MIKYVALAFVALALTACDQVRSVTGAQPASSATPSFEYRVASIERDVEEYRTLGTKSVTINGVLEFMQAGEQQAGSFLLIGKLRIEGAGDTNEQDIFVLIERGRGEYRGRLFADYSMPRTDPSPEIRADQIGFTITGVVPLETAEMSRITDSVARANAPPAEAPPPPAQ